MKPLPLALEGLPPFSVPLRFFLTAPGFGVLAGLVLAVEGESAFATRWSPAMLAATHLLTLGWLAMVMIGALFQVVPVLLGRGIRGATSLAPIVHAALSLGTLALAHAFLGGARLGWTLALVALGLAFAVFVPALAGAVLAKGRGGDAPYALRFAVLGLVLTVALGLQIAAAFAWPSFGFAARAWTDVHARFGLLGWVLLLIVAVSQQVVPMFHVTPPFDSRLVRALPLAILLGLAGLAFEFGAVPSAIARALIATACLVTAGSWLVLLARRRRRRPDATVRAWQCAALALIAAVPIGLFGASPILLGLVFGYGVAVTIVLGMLCKVVPFLAFTHLQRRVLGHPSAYALLPTMEDFVSHRAAVLQLAVHVLALAALIVATLHPAAARIAGAFVILDFGTAWLILAAAAYRHRRAALAIASRLPPPTTGDRVVAPPALPE